MSGPASKVTTEQVRDRVGNRSFQLGREYADSGAILNPQHAGDTLLARCEGSSGGPYEVTATLGARGIVTADCSCLVGGGGRCKHVAALVLAWVANPGRFAVVEKLDEALGRYSTDELIALVKQMLRKHPDLEALVARTPPAGQIVDTQVIATQVNDALRARTWEWDEVRAVAAELEEIVDAAAGLMAAGSHAAAAASYAAILLPVLEAYENFNDQSGDLMAVVHRCAVGLGDCLPDLADAAAHEGAIDALWAACATDIGMGGIELAGSAPDVLLAHATPAEKCKLAEVVRSRLPSADGSDARDWEAQAYGHWYLDLAADAMADNEYLEVCRAAGLLCDLVKRLLKLGRDAEAEAAGRAASDAELFQLATVATRPDRGDLAERLVRERIATAKDYRLLEWLKARYAARADVAGQLEITRLLFDRQPSVVAYRDARTLASKLGTWDGVRSELRAAIARGKDARLTVEVHLEEGEIDEALQAVRHEKVNAYNGYWSGALKLTVAQAAEKTRPEAALGIYRAHAEGMIEQKNRAAYEDAAKYLAKVKKLHESLDEAEEWAAYIAALKERFRRLPALQKELANIKL